MTQPTNPMLARIEGPSPAMEVALDLLRRGLVWAPIAVLGAAAIWGTAGAASAAYALAIVVANFLLSAWLLQVGGRISLAAMAGAAFFGYVLRLGLILAAVLLVKDATWLDPVALGVVLIVSHLGLLFWELRYVSGSMAFPGLKPRPGSTPKPATSVVETPLSQGAP
ncbi:MAG: ATP synthase subunit I [Microthrixaceae bacterium]